MNKTFSIIAAVDPSGGIGFNNQLPWPKLQSDMKHFRSLRLHTDDPLKQNVIIMGRKTFESLPSGGLSGSLNFVLTRNETKFVEGCDHPMSDLDTALQEAFQLEHVENVFVIGGGQLYREAILHPALLALQL